MTINLLSPFELKNISNKKMIIIHVVLDILGINVSNHLGETYFFNQNLEYKMINSVSRLKSYYSIHI